VQELVRARTGLVCSVGVGDPRCRRRRRRGSANRRACSWARPGCRDGRAPDLRALGDRHAHGRLADLRIGTVAELAAADPDLLVARFGGTVGPTLLELGRGGAPRDLVTEPRKPVSRSRQETFPVDLVEPVEIADQVRRLAREVAGEVLAGGHAVAEVGVTVRTATFRTRTRTRRIPVRPRIPRPWRRPRSPAPGRFEIRRPVRLLGVRVGFG
jgi:DNA polymerase-4